MSYLGKKYKIIAVAIINITSIAVLVCTWTFIKSPADALAASQVYNSVWELTKCREVTTYTNQVPVYKLGIGPSAWKVTHTLASGKTIIETWEATGWSSSTWRQTIDMNAGSIKPTSTLADGSAASCSALDSTLLTTRFNSSGDIAATINPIRTGMYSFQAARSNANYSFPLGWKVTTNIQ